MAKKSCWTCKKARIYPGSPGTREIPPEEEDFDCTEERIPDEFWEAVCMLSVDRSAVTAAANCGFYDPKMVEKCSVCDREINEPEHQWELWVSGYEVLPVCSEACQIQGYKDLESDYEYKDRPYPNYDR